MRIVAASDLHGHLPAIPPCDLLILSGDIAPDCGHPFDPSNPYRQLRWFGETFAPWLHSVQAEEIVATGGNHDFALQRMRRLLPELHWHLLMDDGVELFGLKIWGAPWIKDLPGWAFSLNEEQLEARWSRIPDDTDILVLHGPAYGYGDEIKTASNGKGRPTPQRVGSTSLLPVIDRIQPKLVTAGHIHEDKGEWRRGKSLLVNVAIVDDTYQVAYHPWAKRLDELDAQAVTSDV